LLVVCELFIVPRTIFRQLDAKVLGIDSVKLGRYVITQQSLRYVIVNGAWMRARIHHVSREV
jgi:hypothetical protein